MKPPARALTTKTVAGESLISQSQNHSQAIGGMSVAISRTTLRYCGAAKTASRTEARPDKAPLATVQLQKRAFSDGVMQAGFLTAKETSEPRAQADPERSLQIKKNACDARDCDPGWCGKPSENAMLHDV